MTRAHSPIPNCPQPETPIRDRAWTEGQKLSRLRELAELWKAGDFEERECAEKLLAILDAEGDGVPARSGVVSDADVEQACAIFERDVEWAEFSTNPEGVRRDMRAALTNFAKGVEVGGDVDDAARYRWLRRNHNADLLAEDVIDEAIQGAKP